MSKAAEFVILYVTSATFIFFVILVCSWAKRVVETTNAKYQLNTKESPVVIHIDRSQHLTVYNYHLQGEQLPMVSYEQGSNCVKMIPGEVEAWTALNVIDRPELLIYGRNNIKLLAGALEHIGKKVDKII
jgi:hypothetical protein